MKTIVIYNDNTKEEFENKTYLTFWDSCKRILDVKSIEEVYSS